MISGISVSAILEVYRVTAAEGAQASGFFISLTLT